MLKCNYLKPNGKLCEEPAICSFEKVWYKYEITDPVKEEYGESHFLCMADDEIDRRCAEHEREG